MMAKMYENANLKITERICGTKPLVVQSVLGFPATWTFQLEIGNRFGVLSNARVHQIPLKCTAAGGGDAGIQCEGKHAGVGATDNTRTHQGSIW